MYALEEILVEDSEYSGTTRIKIKLLKANLLSYECSLCHIAEWNGKSISLHLDHINGNRTDNRIENLRLLCPNCHSQTDTYSGKNFGRYSGKEKQTAKEKKVKRQKTQKTCITCGINDFFSIYGKLNLLVFFEARIFDRWGEKVLESNNPYFTWDGTHLGVAETPGVFVYTMKATFIDGYSRTDYKGSITLIK